MSELPNGWRKLRFEELAFHISDRVDDPKAAGVEVYVGLEHLDPGSLKIRRRGTPDDVNATKLRVKPGQIIFGKRRAYQRKVAVADFDGICSAHAMVLEANPTATVPGFLPFFMQSDLFFDRAIAISEGSLSPTIKWKVLAAQEFLIPPIDKQKEMVELFQAIEDAIAATEVSIRSAEDLKQILMQEVFIRGIEHTEYIHTELGDLPSTWKVKQVGDLFDAQLGKMLNKDSKTGKSPAKYLANRNVLWNKFDLTDLEWMDFSDEERKKFSLTLGDLLVCEGGEVGRTAIWQDQAKDVYFQKAIHRLRAKSDQILPGYMLRYMNFAALDGRLNKITTQTSIAHLTREKLIALKIPLPPKHEQKQIIEVFDSQDAEIEQLQKHTEKLNYLKKQIVNSLLSADGNLGSTVEVREIAHV
ncbi:type I restriction-modification system S subunit [Leptolyngbya sp. NIES-3755]|nr:type I restriction-modification system S subunit [Leptolyngbya sp. NIES-3755]